MKKVVRLTESDLVRIVKRVLNEDTLVLNSFAKKLYSFLKKQNIESELKREMDDEFNFYNIAGRDNKGEFWGDKWGVIILARYTFEGSDSPHSPRVYVSFHKYTGKGVDKLVEDFLSNFPELKISKKFENDNGEIERIIVIENK